MIRKELLALMEHDNAKYPLEERASKGKKKGIKRSTNESAPVIGDFEEDEVKEADSLIREEAEYLRVAMGHEVETLDDFVESHTLQTEVLRDGLQPCGVKFEATFKQMGTAGTELECFQALQKQEKLAAKHRINDLWEEVQKQKLLEQTLQRRYGDLLAELERTQSQINVYKAQAQKQEEVAAENHTSESAEAVANQTALSSSSELSEPVPSDDLAISKPEGNVSEYVEGVGVANGDVKQTDRSVDMLETSAAEQ
ncbi:hypothetical protein SLA2020_522620 [Shorea laevis]